MGVEAWLFVQGERSLTVSWIEDGRLPESWRAVGTADFDGDGMGDVALQRQDGTLAFWPGASAEVTVLEQAPDDGRWRVMAVDGSGENGNDADAGEGTHMAQPSESLGQDQQGDKVVRQMVSAGDPDAEVPSYMREWAAENGGPYLEIWVPGVFR